MYFRDMTNYLSDPTILSYLTFIDAQELYSTLLTIIIKLRWNKIKIPACLPHMVQIDWTHELLLSSCNNKRPKQQFIAPNTI